MKKLFLIALLLVWTCLAYSQLNTKEISFILSYPVPAGNNFVNKAYGNGYTPIADIGIDYTILHSNNLGIGFLVNSSYLRLSTNNVNLFIISPKIKFDYKIDFGKLSLIPQLGIGYANWRFHAGGVTMWDVNGNSFRNDYKQIYNGLAFKAATKLVVNSSKRLNWYFEAAYEFTKLEDPGESAEKSGYNQDMQMIYPGIGVIWKFAKE